jgi:hypothetical protein
VAAVAGGSREEQLAWEARQRPRAAIAAIAAAILSVIGYLWGGAALRDAPRAGFLESLGQLAATGPIGEQASLLTAGLQFYVDNAVGIIGSAVVRGLGLLGLAWAVTFLAVATRARRPEFHRAAIYVTVVGGALLALSDVLVPLERTLTFQDYLDGPKTVDTARDLGGSVYITGQLIAFVGRFTLAAGVLLVSLNAMRAGLLTRFVGILGVVAGALLVLPQLAPLPVVLWFWMVAAGLIMLGTGRVGLLPAWKTGNAEPWPSAQEAAAARREAEERRQGITPREKPEPTPTPPPRPTGRPHPSSKKRKRKRRG